MAKWDLPRVWNGLTPLTVGAQEGHAESIEESTALAADCHPCGTYCGENTGGTTTTGGMTFTGELSCDPDVGACCAVPPTITNPSRL